MNKLQKILRIVISLSINVIIIIALIFVLVERTTIGNTASFFLSWELSIAFYASLVFLWDPGGFVNPYGNHTYKAKF
jgi:hypothetical protein